MTDNVYSEKSSKLLDNLYNYSPEVRKIIKLSRPFTMTSNQSICALVTATKYIDDCLIAGDIVECGVWAGGSIIASKLAHNKTSNRSFWLFDTFEGMTEPTIKDGVVAQKVFDLETQNGKDSNWLKISKEVVQKNIIDTTGDDDFCNYISGPIEDTLINQKALLPNQIAILRIDTDWHDSTLAALENLFHLVVPGGIVILDDYGFWEGSRLATESFFKKQSFKPFLIPVDKTTVFFQKNNLLNNAL
jgi:O-methyltransferase